MTLAPASLFSFVAAITGLAPPGRSPVEIVQRALDQIGAPEVLARVTALSYDAAGLQYRGAEQQGRTPSSPVGARHEERIAVDFSGDRMAYEFHTADPTVGPRWTREIYANGDVIDIGLTTRVASRKRAAEGRQSVYARRVSLALLRELLANPKRLSLDGPDVVFRPKERGPIQLQFDPADGRLVAVESTIDFPGEGVVPVRFEFVGDVEAAPGLHVPAGHREYLNGRLLVEMSYSNFHVNLPSPLFDVPEDLRASVDPPGTVAVVAPGVYFVENLFSYNLMFVEFRDFVVALEAPAAYPGLNGIPPSVAAGGREFSEAYLKKIRETVPAKPVRYVVVTHHHSDHSGGAPVFLEAGATLLTTPGNQSYFEKMAKGARIETIADERVITDGVRELKLFSVGRNPHTDEMLVAYLPGPNFVYQSDLFFVNDRRAEPRRHYPPVMHFFAGWLAEHHLSPARIFGFHTPGWQTTDDVADVLQSPDEEKTQ